MTVEQLRTQRAELLQGVGMSWERLCELADGYALDADERNIYDSTRAIDYLLDDDDAAA